MTLNGIKAVTLRYFNEFGKPAFQLITASSNIEFTDQKSASITHSGEVSVRTKFTHSRVHTKLPVTRFTLLTSKFHFTIAPSRCVAYPNVFMLGFRLIFSCSRCNDPVLCSMRGRSASVVSFSTPCLVFISAIVWARNFTLDGS